MTDHVHRWVSNVGVDEHVLTPEQFDRQWLFRQGLINAPVSYDVLQPIVDDLAAQYAEESTDQENSERKIVIGRLTAGSVTYGGFTFEDVSGCPVCQVR